ncbi:ATP-binding protein [Schumannella soli]|uniref:ATP-binding protein n=1 Tax=Schumannella soli TaxID=2590779 RepID=A0A506XV31_9MICO|nr:ATP-binding protein [Schumannella soli]
MQDEIVEPGVDLLESMRSVGYSLDAALADLIDNSITADAKTIDIDADVVDGSFVAILDDGTGMSPTRAREALRLAGSVDSRSTADLGRFGLGLKTASLSQARCLTVVTKSDGVTTALRWDIDHVRESRQWSLLVLSEPEIQGLPLVSALQSQQSGTLVVWEYLDLLIGDAADRGAFLRERVLDAAGALALVFHRFLAGPGRIVIRVNGAKLSPIDPFVTSNTRTQISPTDELTIAGEKVSVTAYTLPHPSGMTPAERARTDLSTGMREAQGFYIYRNQRLISRGNWFGLASRSELTKQTRIQVDLPNTVDSLWQLDIKKSRAEPPASFKAHLKRIIDPLLDKGRRVHTYRGRKTSEAEIVRGWNKLDVRGNVQYVVNEDHPLLVLLKSRIGEEERDLLESVIGLLSDTYPTHDLYAEMAASKVAGVALPDIDGARVKLQLLQDAGMLGTSAEEATARLVEIEPFNAVPDLLELIRAVMMESPDATES